MKHLGDISRITKEDAVPVDCITFGSPCFPAGTLVLTDKGYVEIEKVKIGDRCFTHAGNWETVTAVGKKNAPTVKLKGTHYGLVSTYNHPFYSAEQESKWNGNGYDRVLSRVGEWTYASKMCDKRWAVPNNISGIKIPSIEKENKRQNDPPPITPKLMYFIGRWLADGWVRDGQRSNRPKGQMYGQIYICANTNKIEKLEESAKYIFNKNVKIYRIHERAVDKIRINNQALCKWIKNNFGTMADGKKLPAWAFCMPKEYRQSLVNGYFDGDEYCVKDEVWKSTTVSKKLAHGIRLLCETLGYSCSVYCYDVPSTTVIEGRTVSQKPQYQIRASKTKRTNSIKQNGFNWYKCTSVDPYCENQTVYNITVNKDHSYIVEGFVVHNCQNLSIAGKREGLAGEQSGLFIEAVRIIKEMREQSGGLYPTFAVWENVPGAFSSNSGEDFRTVLEELARIAEASVSIPRPKNGKWAKAGFICGNDWSIAWRTFDAQFWGVPQRRRRIAVVVDLGGQRAGEILFESTGMSGNPEPSIPAWKGIARNPAHCATGHDRVVEGAGDCLTPWDVQSRRNYKETGKWPAIYAGEGGGHGYVMQDAIPINDKATRWMGGGKSRNHDGSGNGLGVGDETDPMFTLTAGDRHAVCCIGVDGYNGCETGDKSITIRARKSDQDHVGRVAIPINTQIDTRHISIGERTGMGWGEDGDPAYTLQAGHEHAVCCLLNDQGGQSINVEDGVVSPTLRAESHAHEPIICDAFTVGQGAKANGIGYAEEQAPTLRTDGGLSAMPTVLCRAHGQANAEVLEECSPTLNCNHEQPIVFESHSQDARYTQQGDTSPYCTAQWGTGGNNMPLVVKNSLTPWDTQSRRIYFENGKSPTLSYRENSGQNQQTVLQRTSSAWIVRRLTPTECERLQGYPDGWTDIGEWVDSKGKRHKPTDSPRYKALGNSIALPQWWWITCKMAKYLPEHATLGSLFDGIGGFPLVWETLHGKGTTIWASEIMEFPIAVTKKHFGDGKDG